MARKPKPRVVAAPEAEKPESVAAVDIGESAATFWSGAFGDEYTKRNQVAWNDRVPFLRRIVESTNAQSFLDVGCNAGWNLRALRAINPDFSMSGVDVNREALALATAEGFDVVDAQASEVCEMFGSGSADLVITSGVLIHIPTDQLQGVMQAIRDVSAGYVLAIEYDAPKETEVAYRGHPSRLWKRPFGELYEQLGMSLVEHGVADGYEDCRYWLLSKD